MDRTLRAGTFVLGDGTELHGYTYGATWNGFARPYFTREEGLRLVAVWQQADPSMAAWYDETTDTFLFHDDGIDEPDMFTAETHMLNEQPTTLYPIGNGAWCWDEA